MKLPLVLLAGLLTVSSLDAAAVTFWSQIGSDSSVDDTLDGAVVPDQLGPDMFAGFLGELILMPKDPGILAGVANGTVGMVTADSGGTFSNTRGLIGYCIDSDTLFNVSTSVSNIHTYTAYNYVSANDRYLSEGVSYYRDGALKRAAYLMESFCGIAHAGGDNEAAALQAAIWEVLYDENPNVSLNEGNYFIRAGTVSARRVGLPQTNALLVQQLANQWLQLADADDWGGVDYDPENRVLFWLDPADIGLNQSIITLNPPSAIQPVPEVASCSLAVAGFGVVLTLRRRRQRGGL